jgi:hypothetical protein
MTTLLDVLYEADAIDIDGVFCRYFYMESEEIENDDDIILHVEVNADNSYWEWMFTKKDLEDAIPLRSNEGWSVDHGDETFNIIAYKLNEIKG